MSVATSFGQVAVEQSELRAIFVSLELSLSSWIVTSLSPGQGERMSRTQLAAGSIPALLERFDALQAKSHVRSGASHPVVVIQEAGLDSFSLHRTLEREDVESHVVDPASIAISRRRRRAKTGQDRSRGAAQNAACLQTGRTASLRNGEASVARRRGSTPALPGTDRARKSHKGVLSVLCEPLSGE